MSKFIALLCAAAITVSAGSAIVFAEETEPKTTAEPTATETVETTKAPESDNATEAPKADTTENPAEDDTDAAKATEAPAEDDKDAAKATEAPAEDDKDAAKATEAPAADDDTDTEKATEAPTEEAKTIFTDVADDAYYADSVAYCYEKGLFNGMTDTEFEPDTTMTRGMFATVFSRLQDADTSSAVLTYADVDADAYYAQPVAWATEQGIMDGYSDDEFGPDDAITREQAAKMLYSYLTKVCGLTFDASAEAEYADLDSVSDWAAEGISYNAAIGYLLADENGNINPSAAITRADACYAVAASVQAAEASAEDDEEAVDPAKTPTEDDEKAAVEPTETPAEDDEEAVDPAESDDEDASDLDAASDPEEEEPETAE